MAPTCTLGGVGPGLEPPSWAQPPPQHPPAPPPRLFALGGSNNGVHPRPLSGQPFPPWQPRSSLLCPHLAKPTPSSSPKQYDRQMQGHFSPSHGGLFGKKDPLFPFRSAPQPGSAAGQDRHLSPLQFGAHGTVAPSSPQPSICLSFPVGSTTRSHPHDAVQGSFL